MILRIVRMTFREEEVAAFLAHFEEIKSQIRHFPGCRGLKLLSDAHDPRVFATHSFWDSEDDLNAYRDSELFGKVWPVTKARFAEKVQAYSYTVACEVD